MEIIIEDIRMTGFLNLYNAFQKHINGYYVYNKTDTTDVFLGDSSLWEIRTFNCEVYITNKENNITVTIAEPDFNKIIIQ